MAAIVTILLVFLSAAVVAAAVVPLAYAIGVDDPDRRAGSPAGGTAQNRDQRAGGLTPAHTVA